jgi:hypothetical protein
MVTMLFGTLLIILACTLFVWLFGLESNEREKNYQWSMSIVYFVLFLIAVFILLVCCYYFIVKPLSL